MSDRRRLLEIIATSFKWLAYSYTNLYHSLIPTTIDGKAVQNKAKVSKVYGNSVVENQLVPNGNFVDTSDWSATGGTLSVSNNEGTFILNDTAQYNTGIVYYLNTTTNHKYLLIATIKTSVDNASCNLRQDDNFYYFNSTTSFAQYSWIHTGANKSRMFCVGITSGTSGDTLTMKECMCIDLTLMFPFDTPTSLDDVRVQALLNRGYIAHNTGTLKNVDIGTISTKDSNNQALDTISLKYQGNGVGTAHDTMEITNSDVVFTKNVGSYTFTGSETWGAVNNAFGTSFNKGQKKPSTATVIPNAIVSNGLSVDTQVRVTNGLTDNALALRNNDNTAYVRISSVTTASAMASAMAGKTIYFELETPQVITIPRKRLGIVDLGSLSWTRRTDNNGNPNYFCIISNMYSITAYATKLNWYCSKYNIGASVSTNVAGSSNNQQKLNSIAYYSTRVSIAFGIDYTEQQVQEMMSGVYLFYETNADVADITNMIDIEAGGQISVGEYSYMKNQLLSPNSLQPTSSFTYAGITYSRNTTDKTISASGLATSTTTMDITSEIPITSGHIYYLHTNIVGSEGTYYVVEIHTNRKSYQNKIITLNGTQAKYGLCINNGQNVNLTIQPQLVDLTLWFGAGNEPTSESDSRIQYILSLGYIPTDTTGTLENVDSRVLPNLDVKVKCK